MPTTLTRAFPAQGELFAGGEPPTEQTLKLGGSINLATAGGQLTYSKGEELEVHVTVRIDQVAFLDRRDKEGGLMGVERRHVGMIVAATVVEVQEGDV